MAEGARKLNPTETRRRFGGFAALAFLLVLAGSALAATLLTGWSSGMASGVSGLYRPALFTVWQALLSTVLSLAFAVPVALALESLSNRSLRNGVLALFAIPLSLPAIVAVLAVLSVAGRSGWLADAAIAIGFSWRPDVYGLTGILLVHVFFNMPLAVRLLTLALDSIAEEQWKLAASLKFAFADRFAILIWPEIKSAVPRIAALVFMLCAASYAVILVIGGGPQSATLQTAIQQALTFDLDIARAALLTILQLALTLLLVLVLPFTAYAMHTPGTGARRRWHQSGFAENAGALVLAGAGLAFVGLPVLAVFVSGLAADHARIIAETGLHRAVITSAVIGCSSAMLALVCGWLLASAKTSGDRSGVMVWLERLPLLLLGLPPLVLGIGWFLIGLKLDAVAAMAPVAIIAANALMSVPFVLQMLSPALFKHFSATDRLAATLRLSGWRRLLICDLPALKRPLVQAFLLAFALSSGDLGVVTLFGSDQVLTLPALIYAKMGAYRSNDAAALALYLALATGILTYFAMKGTTRDKA